MSTLIDIMPIPNGLEPHHRSGFQARRRRTEVLDSCTTFLTLSYIIFVNPAILSGAGMNAGAVLVATCLASALGCALMGLYANYPIALAPGMGLNACFVAVAVGSMGLSWQVALGAVFCSGLLNSASVAVTLAFLLRFALMWPTADVAFIDPADQVAGGETWPVDRPAQG